MNSAMMPQEGLYALERISKKLFCAILEKAYQNQQLVSYIGYEQNVELIEKWCNIRLPVNRAQIAALKHGDVLLIMKLKYRLQDVKLKGMQVDEEDFEFFQAIYYNDNLGGFYET
jgi:hypothetical protein